MTAERQTHRVIVAKIGAPHGLNGACHLIVYSESLETLENYPWLEDAQGRRYKLTELRPSGKKLVAAFEDVTRREDIAALTHTELSVPRDWLPAEEEEDSYYIHDLIGLEARQTDGNLYGTVIAVHDFGAGDILEIQRPGGQKEMMPFTKTTVPDMRREEGWLTIAPPEVL